MKTANNLKIACPICGAPSEPWSKPAGRVREKGVLGRLYAKFHYRRKCVRCGIRFRISKLDALFSRMLAESKPLPVCFYGAAGEKINQSLKDPALTDNITITSRKPSAPASNGQNNQDLQASSPQVSFTLNSKTLGICLEFSLDAARLLVFLREIFEGLLLICGVLLKTPFGFT